MATTAVQPEATDLLLISQFLDQLWLDKGVSEHTLSAYGTDLKQFAAFAAGQQQHLLLLFFVAFLVVPFF